MSGITELIKLCNIDRKIRRIENEVNSADDGKQLITEIDSLTRDCAKFETVLYQLKAKTENIKNKVNSGVSEKKKMESRLYSDDMSPKQIENIQTHLKKLSAHIDELETSQLELLDKLDKYEAYKTKLQTKRDNLLEDYENKASKYKSLKNKAKMKLAALSRERDEHISRMDNENVVLYEKMKKRKAGIAMAEVENKLCTGCNQTISASLDQCLSEEPDEIHYCSNCGRIVYRIKVEQ